MAIKWEGGWSGIAGLSQISYYEGDIVSHENLVYIVRKGVPIVPIGSPAPPLDLSNWDVMIAGNSGTSGTSGTGGGGGVSVPTGGTSGQVLAKIDSTDGNVEWVDQTGGAGTGTSGLSGVSGTSGLDGTSGTSGTSGPAGTSGTSGISGVDGTSGTSGEEGLGFNYLGAWLNTTAYGKNDVVRYGIKYRVYVALETVAIGEDTPDINPKWSVMVVSGNNGQTLSPQGVEASYADLIANHPTPNSLDTFILQDTSEMWIYDPTSGAADVNGWVNMGAIQGAPGLDGPAGSSGTSGTSGRDGTSGVAGTSGTSGVNGTSGLSGVNGTSGSSGTSGTTPPGKTYIHTAGTSGTSWTITHSLGSLSPLVQVYDTSGYQLIPASIQAVDQNSTKITFATLTTGRAIISSGWNGTSGSSGTSGINGISQGVFHTQGTAGTSWTITHNLNNYIPIVQVYDTDNKMIIPKDIILTDQNTVTISFTNAQAGKAVITNGDGNVNGTSGTSGTSGFGVATGGTSGQVLAKIDGDNFNTQWITIEKDVLLAKLSVDQTITAIGNNIQFVTAVYSKGGLSASSGVITGFKAGKVYECTAACATSAAASYLVYQFHTDNTTYSGIQGISPSTDRGTVQIQPTAIAIVSDITSLRLKVTDYSTVNGANTQSENTYLLIKEL